MMRPGDEYRYQQYHPQYQQQQGGGPWGGGMAIGGTPHGLIMAVVVGLVVGGPLFLGDGGEAVTSAIADMLGPTGLLLLPVCLILVIRVLSTERGAARAALADALYLGGGSGPDYRVAGGSPVGVALALVLIVVLLYYRSAILGGDGGDDE